MTSPNSVWDRNSLPKVKSPAFSLNPSRIILEFENRRRGSLSSYKLARVTFTTDDLNESRAKAIEENLDKEQYHSVYNTHTPLSPLSENNEILCHGARVSNGLENCSIIGSVCVGSGTNSQCERGKCKIGVLSETGKKGKWRFDSATVPGLYYYVLGIESVRLKSIRRGEFTLPAGQGTVSVPRLASISTTVYLPPKTYSDETFVRRVIRYESGGKVVSLQDSLDNFVRSLLGENLATVEVEQELIDRTVERVSSSIPRVWSEFITQAINNISTPSLTNREFLVEAYGVMTDMYSKGLQQSLNSIKFGKVSIDRDISRPVYNRLPGVSGSYNSEDNPDNLSKWVTSGVDSYLTYYKNHILDRFYQIYLNPETCHPECLDWVAQHVGLAPAFWDLEWDYSLKRLLILNAQVNRLSGDLWGKENETFRTIDQSIIETVNVNGSSVTTYNRFYKKSYNTTTSTTSITPVSSLKVDVSRWEGIIPSKGSLLTLFILFYIFGIKAVSGEELKYDISEGTFSVKSGLRKYEFSSPVNIPYSVDVLHVGDDQDLETGNFPNQLIADVSTCYDEKAANTVVIRMPFYYNRNGRTWDATQYIVDKFVPTTAISRVQYAYAAADLLVADDIFFEPVVE